MTRRLFAPAADGETVPISLLHRKDCRCDGTAPCLLYGYGAYGITIPAAFSTNRLSLVDRGFVFAIAHVRGGTDKGWRWYREGKLAQEVEHVHRLHRCRRASVAQALDARRPHRGPGRVGRRHADRRDRQHAAGRVRRA